MVASVSSQSTLIENAEIESEAPLWLTARTVDALFTISLVGIAAASIALTLATEPLALFVYANLIPLSICLAILCSDPSYSDLERRARFSLDIDRLGIEAFIKKHGWDRLDQCGFCFSGRSPLITREDFTRAFFNRERSANSPLLWEGLKRDLFVEESFGALADLLLADMRVLITQGRIGQALSQGVFAQRQERLAAQISKYLRQASAYDVLVLWPLLKKNNAVPRDFPLKAWASKRSDAIERFDQEIRLRRKALSESYQSNQRAIEERAQRERKEALDCKEPSTYRLREISLECEKELSKLRLDLKQSGAAIDKQEKQLRASLEEDFKQAKGDFELYFSFEERSLKDLIKAFGIEAIEKSRSAFGFPRTSDWSDKFIREGDAPVLLSLEKGLLDERGILKAESIVLKQSLSQDPWKLAESSELLRFVDLGLFADRTPLLKALSRLEPLREPLRLLRCYSALDRRGLIPPSWGCYPWLEHFGPTFAERLQYFAFASSSPFLREQREQWEKEVLESIYGVADREKFEYDLAELSLEAFIERYGWNCTVHLCLEEVKRRFFSLHQTPEEWLDSDIIWLLTEEGCLDEERRLQLEHFLLENIDKTLLKGHARRAVELELFTDHDQLRSAIDQLDPMEHRTLLVGVWPWLKRLGLIGDSLYLLSHWFEAACEGLVDEALFNHDYASKYSVEKDWRSMPLIDWIDRYSEEAFLERAASDPSVMNRWESECELWRFDRWNWIFFERGLLSDRQVKEWMRALVVRHPTLRDKILSEDFKRAFDRGLFSDGDLKEIADSFHHPSTFESARDLMAALGWVTSLQITFNSEEKLLYNWVKERRGYRDYEDLERAFACYKTQIGWRAEPRLDFEIESKRVLVEEQKSPLKKIFQKP